MPTASDGDLAEFAYNAGFIDPVVLATAIAIAIAESTSDETALHHNADGSTDYGLWQINSSHPDVLSAGDWRDGATNARMARAVYEQAGEKFTPWSTYTSGIYRLYSGRASAAAKLQLDGVAGHGPSAVGDTFPGESDLTKWMIWIAQGGTSVPIFAPAGPSQAGPGKSKGVTDLAGGKWSALLEDIFPGFGQGIQEALWIGAGSLVLLLGVVVIIKQGGIHGI